MGTLEDTDEWQYLPLLPTSLDKPLWRPVPVHMDAAGQTHRGKVRTENQDHFLIARYGRFFEAIASSLPADDTPAPHEISGDGLLVADGLGGQAAGEAASRMAINLLFNLVVDTPDWIFRLDDEQHSAEVQRRTTKRMEEISQAMTEQADADPDLRGFGTTMTVACGIGVNWFVAHLGDSRAYLLRDGVLARLTRDHTVAQEMLEAGLLDEEQAEHHRLRHRLTRLLGDEMTDVEPEVWQLRLQDGDCLLLCTDGLTNMVTEEAIADILKTNEPVREVVRELVEAALEAGGRDNVTAVVARFQIDSKD